jgi:predicted DNA-binding WGR domain protein
MLWCGVPQVLIKCALRWAWIALSFAHQYGKVGAKGTTQTKDFGTGELASAYLKKQTAAKRKNGYRDAEPTSGSKRKAVSSVGGAAAKKVATVATAAKKSAAVATSAKKAAPVASATLSPGFAFGSSATSQKWLPAVTEVDLKGSVLVFGCHLTSPHLTQITAFFSSVLPSSFRCSLLFSLLCSFL